MKNIWLDGIMGLVVGDALGCPVQFMNREEIRERGLVAGMEGYGTYNMPEGTWTDDSSMALATMDSIIKTRGIDPEDIMKRFVSWEFEGEYTPFGQAFDQGITCSNAIWKFRDTGNYRTCGRTGEHANGNGALMRILPVCLYYIEREKPDEEAVQGIHVTSGLTHNHLRSKMACGLYYFLAKEIIKGTAEYHNGLRRVEQGRLKTCLQRGIDAGLKYYGQDKENLQEMTHFGRLFDLGSFSKTPEDEILSTGYVIDSLEAAIWCLLTTESLKECLLKAVNLGDDTDTVAAIAGGLAGLYYGYDRIPADWLAVIKERTYVEEMCRKCSEITVKSSC